MQWWERVRRKINSAKTSTTRTQDGVVQVSSSARFGRGLPLSLQKDITGILEEECRQQVYNALGGRAADTLQTVKARAEALAPLVLNTVNGQAGLVERVADAIGYRDYGQAGYGGSGGMRNLMWMTGVAGQDPALANSVMPNIYITPGEAASLYSQKGLPEIIINKKARSMLLNGVRIKNVKLSPEQIETVEENMIKTGLASALSEALAFSLVYGGALLFPFFKKDSPLSMTLPVQALAQYGIIGKDCIERWLPLDRWNTVHFPSWNPTAADFLKPKYFYIPFLGTDVHSSRMARVVTAPQPGYWGVMMNMGWGISDFPGWIESCFNYYAVMKAIPTMINQMSILARTFNIDGPMAMEGAAVLNQMSDEETIKIRQTSPLNPINLDVIGKLEAIQRDFAQVPELTRLLRQDLTAKAGFLEESIFSVERKGMGGGGDKDQSWTRQEETNRMIYATVQPQLKPIAMLQVINALGVGRDVLKALPYTEISFDEQKLVDVEDRTKVLATSTKGFFDSVAGGLGLADAAELVEQLSGGLITFSSDTMRRLVERQKLNEEREQEQHEMEMKLGAAQEIAAKQPPASSSASGGKSSTSHSYKDPLEQKKHEKTKSGGSKKQGLARQQNKKVG